MYLGVDVGGTKTLVAVLNDDGVIVEQAKFPTPKDYEDFLEQLAATLKAFETRDFRAGGAGIPGRLDREHGRALNFGNLPWRSLPVQDDLEKLAGCPFVIENDAKMAGLSEAMLLKDKFERVLYITVSTGIGLALIDKGVIDVNIGDSGGRALMLPHKGKLMPWEEFVSGRAIVERFGKRAADINDDKTWRIISHDLAQGLIHLIAITDPDVIVLGGGVGTHFEKFKSLLKAELEKYQLPMVSTPALVKAQRPEQAVIYGCYDLAKQDYGHA